MHSELNPTGPNWPPHAKENQIMRIRHTLMKFGHSTAVSSLCCVVTLLLMSVPQTEAAFSTPSPLTNTSTDTSDQQVATSGSNVYIVWKDVESGAVPPNFDVYFARSLNGGTTLEAPQNISQ